MILGVILVLSGYYTWDNFAKLIKSGFSSTGPTAALFVFSVLYFGIMTDAGMFDIIINNHAAPALTMCSTLMAAVICRSSSVSFPCRSHSRSTPTATSTECFRS